MRHRFARHIGKAVIALAALSLAISTPTSPAFAQSNCTGCNVVDDGLFSTALIGRHLVWRQDGRKADLTIVDVDIRTRRIYARFRNDPNRGVFVADAVYIYTPARSHERETMMGVGVTAGAVAVAACLFGVGGICRSGNSQQNSGATSSNRGSSSGNSEALRRCLEFAGPSDGDRIACTQRYGYQ